MRCKVQSTHQPNNKANNENQQANQTPDHPTQRWSNKFTKHQQNQTNKPTKQTNQRPVDKSTKSTMKPKQNKTKPKSYFIPYIKCFTTFKIALYRYFQNHRKLSKMNKFFVAGLVVCVVATIACILSTAIPYWAYGHTEAAGREVSVASGLWKVCYRVKSASVSETECKSYEGKLLNFNVSETITQE